MKKFEMAHADNPEELIMATQRSLLSAMEDVISGLRQDCAKSNPGVPGLTWEEIQYLIDGFKKKRPEIIHQEGEM